MTIDGKSKRARFVPVGKVDLEVLLAYMSGWAAMVPDAIEIHPACPDLLRPGRREARRDRAADGAGSL